MYFLLDSWTVGDINSRLYFCSAWDDVISDVKCMDDVDMRCKIKKFA